MDIYPLLFIRMCAYVLRIKEWIASGLDGHKRSVLALGYLKFQVEPEFCNLNKFPREETIIVSVSRAIGKENIKTQFL